MNTEFSNRSHKNLSRKLESASEESKSWDLTLTIRKTDGAKAPQRRGHALQGGCDNSESMGRDRLAGTMFHPPWACSPDPRAKLSAQTLLKLGFEEKEGETTGISTVKEPERSKNSRSALSSTVWLFQFKFEQVKMK